MKKYRNFIAVVFSFSYTIIIAAFSTQAQTPEYVGPRSNIGDDPANGIYVSPNGNDSNATGSIDKPFKSINKALTKAESGATIIICGGTYREERSVRVRKPNITIKSRKGEWAIIDMVYNPQYEWDSGVIFDYDASGGKLQSVEVRGGFYAVSIETTFRWDPTNPFTYGASDITIEDCKLHHSRYDVVKVKPNCNNVTIRYNEIHNSGQAFTPPFNGDDNAEGIDNVNGDNMTVHNNYIHDICTNGIYAKGGATDVVIEKNRIERTYGAGIMVGFDTNLEWFDSIANPQYYENIRGIVRNNLIIDSGWEGIGLYASKDAQVYNNTVVNAVCGISQYHSALYFGVSPQDYVVDLGHPANVNSNIHHNVVCEWSSSNRPMIEIRYSSDCGGISALSGMPNMSKNCYYIAGKNAVFNDQRPNNFLVNAVLTDWKLHINGDNGSIEVNPELNADYLTTNPQCEGMGIQFPLIVNNNTDINTPVKTPEVFVNIINGNLIVESPFAETIQLYSITGALLSSTQKIEGKMSYFIHQPKGTLIIVKGSSGWAKKLIVK